MGTASINVFVFTLFIGISSSPLLWSFWRINNAYIGAPKQYVRRFLFSFARAPHKRATF